MYRFPYVLALVALPAGFAASEEAPLAPLVNFGKVAVASTQTAGAVTFEQVFGGTFDSEPASSYPEASELRRLGRAVGRLDVAFARGVGYCTAFLISDQYLMTNAHCLDAGPVQAIKFVTGYVETGVEEGTGIYDVGAAPVEISPRDDLDYAILQVFGDPAAEWGTLELDAVDIDASRDAGMPLIVLGHPVFQVAPVPVPQALYVSRKECQATDRNPLASNRLRHTCDTLGGNSGSPVFSDDTRKVIALHHAGDTKEGINFAIPISLIAKRSQIVARLVAVEAPEGPKTTDEELAAAVSELARLRAELDAARSLAEAEARRLAEERASKAAATTEAERLAREKAEAEARRLADELAAAQAKLDRLDRDKAALTPAGVPAVDRTETLTLTLPGASPAAKPDPSAAGAPPPVAGHPEAYQELSVQPLEGLRSLGKDRPSGAAFSPDGRMFAITDFLANYPRARPGVGVLSSKPIYLWDTESGRRVATLNGHLKDVLDLEFAANNGAIVSSAVDGTARLWNVTADTSRTVARVRAAVEDVALSPDGTWIVTASGMTLTTWEVADPNAAFRMWREHQLDHEILGVAISPQGKTVVTALRNGTAVVLDTGTLQRMFSMKGHSGPVNDAVFSPDGARIATLSDDGTVRLWNAADGAALGTLVGHSGSVHHVAFSPDGTRLVSVAEDGMARVWDAASLQPIQTLRIASALIYSAAFLPDTLQIITASGDSKLRVWGRPTPPPAAPFATSADASASPAKPVTESARFSGDYWRKQVLELQVSDQKVYAAVMTPDGNWIATASDAGVQIWDVQTGKSTASLPVNYALDLALSPDGKLLAVSTWRNDVEIWRLGNGKNPVAVLGQHEGNIWSVAFSADGKRLVTASDDKAAAVWDVESGRRLVTLSGHADRVTMAVFSRDGTRILTGSTDKTARIWDASNGTLLHTLDIWSSVTGLDFAPDGASVVTARAVDLKVWDARTGQLLTTWKPQAAANKSVAFSPDGTRLVTASQDKTVKVWNVADLSLLATLAGHENLVYDATFTPDGTQILTTSRDGRVRLWGGE